jgi:pyruvate dehydrogenase E1 component alpha subunit
MKEKCRDFYHKMLLIRRFEEKAAQLYTTGKIAGFCHLYIGQEAVVTGMLSVAQKEDTHITSYRDHGHMIALGCDLGSVMAELMGKSGGCSKGKGGSMHMFDPSRGFYGGHGIVGSNVSIGTGLAFAERYNDGPGITYVYYGDGAAHQGQVYESYNMAKLWNLPVVYIIENNEYAMGTSVERATATTDLYKRGESFDIPGIRASGMDVLEMEKAAAEASTYVKQGKGPFLIEAKTYRYRGHSMSDPATYRTKSEVRDMIEYKDPINNLAQLLLSKKFATQDELDGIEAEVKARVVEAVKFAESSPFPSAEDLFTDIE